MKILVVEDMAWIRKGIVKMLSNLNISVDDVLQAANGKEALLISEKYQPALVITDIKMPGMNGLEFIKAAKKLIPTSEFIIVTGYAEFDYAKQAVDLGVKGFLLKPIQNDKFEEAFTKALEALEDKEIHKRIIREKNTLKQEQEQLYLQNKFNKIFLGKEQVDWQYPERYNILIVIQLGFPVTKDIKDDIYAFLEEEKNIKIVLAENYINSNELFMLLSCSNKSILTVEKESIAIKLYKELERRGLNCYIALSSIKDSVSKDMYNEIREAFISKLFSQEKIYTYDKVEYNQRSLLYKEKLNLLKISMEKGELSLVREILEEILYGMEGNISFTQMKIILSLISNLIVDVYHLSYDEVKKYKLFTDDLTLKCNTMESIIEKLYYIIQEMAYKKNNNASVDHNMIQRIREYIEKHYMEELTASAIADYLNISSAYLSTIFRKNTGEKLSGYITNIRIKRACELLRDSNINVSDISIAVGYQDVQYFYRVFKKCMGLTPLNYRKKQMTS